jgi:hypothetical protein
VPVPPCAVVSGVVRPVIDVISLLAPDLAALNAVLAPVSVDAPVPPLATGRAVVNVVVPVTARLPPIVKLSPLVPVCWFLS